MREFIKDIIRHVVLTDPGNKWPTFDGGTLSRDEFVTASESATCIRRLSFEKNAERATVTIPDYWETISDEEYFERLNAMGDDDKRGIFERGHHMELWVEEKLKLGLAEDEVVICTGKKQLSFYLGLEKVSGTPDGMFLNTTHRTIKFIEVKSTDNPVTAPRANHVAQTQTNMGIVQQLIDDEKLHSVHGWNLNGYTVLGGSILYINPSNYLTMQEFWLDYDSGEAMDNAANKAALLFTEGGEVAPPECMPPEGLEQWGGCTFCHFKSACMEIEERKQHDATAGKLRALMEGQTPATKKPLPFFAPDAKREDVLKIIADYDAWNKAEKNAEEHKKALKGAIVEWVKRQAGMKASFEDNGRLFKVSFSSSDKAGSLDSDKLAEFLSKHDENLDNFRKAGGKTETLLVKVSVTGL